MINEIKKIVSPRKLYRKSSPGRKSVFGSKVIPSRTARISSIPALKVMIKKEISDSFTSILIMIIR